MKTIKLLSGVLLVFSTMFLFDRCTGSDDRAQQDTTGSGKNATSSSTQSAVAPASKVEGCTLDNGACNNAERYGTQIDGGGKEILPETGKTMVTEFYDTHDRSIIKGGFISKEPIDIDLVTLGEETIVIEGWRAVDASGSTPTKVVFDSSIPAADRYKTFASVTLCPTMCGFCGY